ncbi:MULTISPECIES: CYTH domain-containing protein [Oceanobacillus]|uniref:CYTH domain-containing protein n=1 Tax=Oceanobacillus kimchii TaxID=746691 RepID=A0ABQ5TM93_9BACI|nr:MULTISPECIES: CYTH domain-containing protein [Oceanobacillus]MBT2599022.1 CYTH domain-containing protein [Oceanobacillus sp. ISL-74]MBT2651940.1 CYTH domain-containing protein [Oceanobacillus sp. ISL-73]MCT1578723.1 CYTH domain-containing protein [Oceanobacillus kimchii]MCT2136228.1 CYTH domain-containing protein [Oceanobacillus kimchii]OEH54357.1 adenylate cyclase [Oceanobacillus sp. E9]
MSQEIEIEYKNLLTKDEFIQLQQDLSFPTSSVKQTNYYFETKNFDLKKHGSALRIRKKQGQYQLTLKQPHEDGLLETHDDLTEQEFQKWIHGEIIQKPHTTKQLSEMNISPTSLNYAGYLTTNRMEIEFNGTQLVLDHSNYLGIEDFELELESATKEHGEKVFHGLLNKYHIPIRQTPSKIERFFHQM